MALRFVDDGGTEWEVWEVRERRVLADAPLRRRGRGDQVDPSWLYFESATQRRRLARYPQWWHAMAPRALGDLCRAASPEPLPPTLDAAVRANVAR